MTIKEMIKDYFAGRIIRREEFGNRGYWIGYARTGFPLNPTITDNVRYDGKYKVHRTFEQIGALVPPLKELLRQRRIISFKHKSEKNPIDPEYADKLPPVFIYLREKDRQGVDAELDNLGLGDRVWISDRRTGLALALDELREFCDATRKA